MKLSKLHPRTVSRVAKREFKRWRSDLWIRWINFRVRREALITPAQKPVVFFNASTRIADISLNSAYSLVASWAVRLAGTPVVHFACQAGLSHCVLGSSRQDLHREMPCRKCVRRSRIHYGGTGETSFSYQPDPLLASALEARSVDELSRFEQPIPGDWSLPARKIPLGQLVLPALRWFLRRHNLIEDESTRYIFREFILSAWNVACAFYPFMQRVDPQLVVVFNGQFFPEATARWIAQQRGLRVITHEVGLYPLTGFFTDGEATIYPIRIADDYELGPAQNARLDAYLDNRFRGKFSMAGIRFWPEMRGLDADLLERLKQYRQVVPVFTNVVFDTSQPHSNVLFQDMFAWLDTVLDVARKHPETLFVIRAHPDEARPSKAANESVAGWVQDRRAADMPNVMFVPPDEYISSYELIRRSKFVMIYNSTIGLEASIMGKPVLSAGRSRFTEYPTVFFPKSVAAYRRQVEEFLGADQIEVPAEHARQSRRFLYYQVFRVSLPFDAFLEPAETPGFIFFKSFNWRMLSPQKSPTVRAILGCLFDGRQFELEESS
jgi:hypothetical protein